VSVNVQAEKSTHTHAKHAYINTNDMLKFAKPSRTTGQNLVGLWRPSFTRVDQKLYLFGGGGHVTNDLHVLDLVTMHWDCIVVSSLSLFCRLGAESTFLRGTQERQKKICDAPMGFCPQTHDCLSGFLQKEGSRGPMPTDNSRGILEPKIKRRKKI
jgi:hypothetical protein